MAYLDPRARLFVRHRVSLVEAAAPIVGSRSGAEDVVQEADLHFSAAGVDRADILKPLPYLYQIVRRLAIDWVRSRNRERTVAGSDDVLDDLAAPAASPEQAALYRQQISLVADALAELPERTRLAFEMHRLGGYKLQDIADELGILVTLAHQLVQRALAHCAGRLA